MIRLPAQKRAGRVDLDTLVPVEVVALFRLDRGGERRPRLALCQSALGVDAGIHAVAYRDFKAVVVYLLGISADGAGPQEVTGKVGRPSAERAGAGLDVILAERAYAAVRAVPVGLPFAPGMHGRDRDR